MSAGIPGKLLFLYWDGVYKDFQLRINHEIVPIFFEIFAFEFYFIRNKRKLVKFYKKLPFLFFFWGGACHIACGVLVPPPGIKPTPLAFESWCLNHWTTREIPKGDFAFFFSFLFFSHGDFKEATRMKLVYRSQISIY